MVVVSRYNTGGDESDVSRNKLGITDLKVLGNAETVLLRDAYSHFFKLLHEAKLKLDLNLLIEIHKYFLAHLYTWAGKIRTVNISKGDAFFAPAQNIENALKQFEPAFEKNKPSSEDSKEKIAKKLAFIHCELNVIHPFREGNGRTLRLFLDLLTVHAGYEVVAFKEIPNKEFIQACRKGMLQDYGPMKNIYMSLLGKTSKK